MNQTDYLDWFFSKGVVKTMKTDSDTKDLRFELEKYENDIKKNPKDTESWFNKAEVLLELGEFEQAIESYNKVLEIVPNDAEALFNKGNALFELKRYKEALHAYEASLSVKSDLVSTWNRRRNSV